MSTDNVYDKRIYDEMVCIMWGLLCDSVSFSERNSPRDIFRTPNGEQLSES